MADREVHTAADLWSVHPSQFTALRNALAARLAKAGHKHDAAEVKALRKPSLALWVINCTAREDAPALQALLHAAQVLQTVQRQLLSAETDAAALRVATKAFRHQTGAFVATALKVAAKLGEETTPVLMERIRNCVAALPTAPEDRWARLQAGALNQELSAVGFGEMADVQPTLVVLEWAKPPQPAGQDQGREEAEARRRGVLEAERVVEDAQRDLDRAEQRVGALADQARHLGERALTAEEVARHARRAADEAVAQGERAQQDRDRAQTLVRAAHERLRSMLS
jgi:hypothetical protein